MITNKRALISVYDKTNIRHLAQSLIKHNFEIISTGGTYKYLQQENIPVTEINEITHFPEILDGRVKTLHPTIHAGILAKRNLQQHCETLANLAIKPIDLVVVNLYPFFEKQKLQLQEAEMIEFIDIGGPSMLRAAAKSFEDVIVLSDISDYQLYINQLTQGIVFSYAQRKRLAAKVFNLTSAYDAAIATYLLDGAEEFPAYLSLSYEKKFDLRYGENPHQKAALYIDKSHDGLIQDFEQLQGKELSFNNIRDMDLAYKVVAEFEEIACCVVKHTTPCGVAIADTVSMAYEKAYNCDPISIFGGIIAFNTTVDAETAESLAPIFLELILAPDFTLEAIDILQHKKNLRLIKVKQSLQDQHEYVKIDGGLLVQDTDKVFAKSVVYVTKKQPNITELADLIFAQKVVKHVKSNAIVVAKNGQTLGIGTGQTNRIWATEQALKQAQKLASDFVLASDAFFPFSDVVETCAANGVKAIIQPGGSIRDKESIESCDKHDLAMVFTNLRHFKH